MLIKLLKRTFPYKKHKSNQKKNKDSDLIMQYITEYSGNLYLFHTENSVLDYDMSTYVTTDEIWIRKFNSFFGTTKYSMGPNHKNQSLKYTNIGAATAKKAFIELEKNPNTKVTRFITEITAGR